MIVNYEYVDETADIARHYSFDLGYSASSSLASGRRRSDASSGQRSLTELSIPSDAAGSPPVDRFLPSHESEPDGILATSAPYGLLSPGNQSSASTASPHHSYSSFASLGPRDFVSSIGHGLANLDEHEACLMRYFVVQLAPWVRVVRSHLSSILTVSL